MRGYFGLGQLSASEKQDILNQHKSVYNGYQTMQPQVSNTQPLYVYDAAGDKEGFVVNNRGEVKKYTNMGINEQVETNEVCDECGAMIMDGMCTECNYGHMEEGMGETCEQCGGTMKEDVCEQCNMEEGMGETCEQCGGSMKEDVCEQCGGSMKEGTGHLDDIYDEEDLNPNAGFDYIEGSSNDVDTFEGMHKKLYKESDMYDTDMDTRTSLERKRDMYDTDMDTRTYLKRQRDKSDVGMDDSDFQDYESSYTEDGVDDPNNEDDGFEDMNASEVTDGELDELGIADLVKGKKYKYNHPLYPDEFEFDDEHKYETGSNMYSFRSGEKGYALPSKHVEDFVSDLDDEDDDIMFEYDADDMDVSDVKPAYNFDSNGPGDVYPVNELDEDDMYGYDPEKMYEFDEMESAWADEELEEQPDISGVQGIYGAMDRAYDFDSDGPGKGGPYQEFSYESELDEDEDFTATEDDFEEVEDDLRESFMNQKTRIMEMFNRFNKYN
jgi:hypothetical protein